MIITDLAAAILAHGQDDWVPLLAMDGLARAMYPAARESERREHVLRALADLIDAGLVDVGIVTQDGSFEPWAGTSQEVIGRLTRDWPSDGQASDIWGFCAWTQNTTEGDAIARAERT
jgi:hypothetical protein